MWHKLLRDVSFHWFQNNSFAYICLVDYTVHLLRFGMEKPYLYIGSEKGVLEQNNKSLKCFLFSGYRAVAPVILDHLASLEFF